MTQRAGPVARFDDHRSGRALRVDALRDRFIAWRPDEVPGVIAAAESAAARGAWAFGVVAYEAAAAFDDAFPATTPPPGLPYAWFGVADEVVEEIPGPDPTSGAGPFRLDPWRPDWTPQQHAVRVDAVRAEIAQGNTYQVNLTTRLRSRLTGDPLALYHALGARQRGAYHAYLDLGAWVVASASPECFIEWDGHLLRGVPMKGTAPRGATPDADEEAKLALQAATKERAENVMIVDLIRNDMMKVAHIGPAAGPVAVRDLLRAEPYPTLWQLTSTVEAHTRPGTSLADVFAAMFPCGSITGAPKASTMHLIARLEDAPRGVYCGAIGMIAPGASSGAPRASFSVAIRTVVVDRADGSAVYGVGGGVTWPSTAAGEYAELLTKARVLDATTTRAGEAR